MSRKDWNIRPRAKACHKSGAEFEEGQVFVSRLVEGEEAFEREDIAIDVWTDDLKEGALSIWQSVFKAPPPPDEEPLKPETIEDTLRMLMQRNEPEDVGAIFILAMQMERKRQLVPRDRKRRADGMLILIYEHKQTGETFIVPDPEWKLEEIAEVQREVALRLGWIEPEVPAELDEVEEASEDQEEAASDNVAEEEGVVPEEEVASSDESEQPEGDGEALTGATQAG